jgi:hypothetical protein
MVNIGRVLVLFGVVAAIGVVPIRAHAVTFGFGCITGNVAANCATGEAQLSVDVTAGLGNTASFTFTNVGPNASSITDIYFDDGTLIGIASVSNGPGTSFTQFASPRNLPGGQTLTPAFETSKGFSVDSDPPIGTGGVNNSTAPPLEFVTIVFNLLSGVTFSDTLAALADGDLRIGVHVQAFNGAACTSDAHGCDGSESFVNRPRPRTPVPEPSTLLLTASVLLGLGMLWNRRQS